jgi:hypothetical protein
MTRGRLLSAISLALPALGLGLGLTASQAHATAQPAPAVTAPPVLFSEQPVVLDCPGTSKPLVRPGQYIFACADDGDYLTGLHWINWSPGIAVATGKQEINDCTPYCYDGHFHAYPVYVMFWGGAAVKGHPGEQQYTKVTMVYPGVRPPVYKNGHPVAGPVSTTAPLPPFLHAPAPRAPAPRAAAPMACRWRHWHAVPAFSTRIRRPVGTFGTLSEGQRTAS